MLTWQRIDASSMQEKMTVNIIKDEVEGSDDVGELDIVFVLYLIRAFIYVTRSGHYLWLIRI